MLVGQQDGHKLRSAEALVLDAGEAAHEVVAWRDGRGEVAESILEGTPSNLLRDLGDATHVHDERGRVLWAQGEVPQRLVEGVQSGSRGSCALWKPLAGEALDDRLGELLDHLLQPLLLSLPVLWRERFWCVAGRCSGRSGHEVVLQIVGATQATPTRPQKLPRVAWGKVEGLSVAFLKAQIDRVGDLIGIGIIAGHAAAAQCPHRCLDHGRRQGKKGPMRSRIKLYLLMSFGLSSHVAEVGGASVAVDVDVAVMLLVLMLLPMMM
mmetsp:Transcript_40691/g.61496  ORF Transcript_40691/g.61496 Transcript_40691/m.61496 type:complete len:266 (+) Transcript_40691:298-1095(+)